MSNPDIMKRTLTNQREFCETIGVEYVPPEHIYSNVDKYRDEYIAMGFTPNQALKLAWERCEKES